MNALVNNHVKLIQSFYSPLEKTAVSVHILVFNHKKSIRRCLDSVLMQMVNFNVEILIHDDCSTDGSTSICEEYSNKYPQFIKLFKEEHNLYTKEVGVFEIEKKLTQESSGEFIALCEGDDYWIDKTKLYCQYHSMKAHKDCFLCTHSVLVKNFVSGEIDHLPKKRYSTGVINSDLFIKIINKDYSFQTSSFFFERNHFMKFHETNPLFARIMPTNDESWLLYFGSIGNVFYIDKEMSCYNKETINSWSSKSRKFSKEEKYNQRVMVAKALEEFNLFTNLKFKKTCIERISFNLVMNLINENNFEAIFKNKDYRHALWRINKLAYIKKRIKYYVFRK